MIDCKICVFVFFFFFKQKTAYEMAQCDWSSDVCSSDLGWAVLSGVFVAGVYGGYFGAAQGILLLAILGVALAQNLQRTNALKNVLAGLVNGVAGVYFAIAAHVAWAPAGIIAVGSIT